MVSDRTNFWLHVAEGAVCSIGMMVFAGGLAGAAMVRDLGGRPWLIGLMAAFLEVGKVAQFLAVRRFERARKKKRLVLLVGLGMRLPYIATAAAVLALGASETMRPLALGIVAAAGAVTAVSCALNIPPWMDMLGDTIPACWHGRYFGHRGAITTVAGFLSGFVVYGLLGRVAFPLNYALMIATGFVMTMASWVIYLFVNDTPDEAARAKQGSPPSEGLLGYLRTVPRLFREDAAFRRFVVFSAFVAVAGSVNDFRGNAALDGFGLEAKAVGRFTSICYGFWTAGCLLFPRVADRLGHRTNLAVASGLMVASNLVAALARSPGVYAATFALWGLSLGVTQVSWMSYMLERAPAGSRMRYLSAQYVVLAPLGLVSPVAAGMLVGWTGGYRPLFAVAAVLSAAAAALAMGLPGGAARTRPDPLAPVKGGAA